MRPELPLLRVWSQQLSEILRMCWDREPSMRPAFAEVDKQVQQLRARYGADLKESPAPRRSELERMKTKKSPDMHPIPLPLLPRPPSFLLHPLPDLSRSSNPFPTTEPTDPSKI